MGDTVYSCTVYYQRRYKYLVNETVKQHYQPTEPRNDYTQYFHEMTMSKQIFKHT